MGSLAARAGARLADPIRTRLPGGHPPVSLQVDEKNFGYLRLGWTAAVVADGYPGQSFAAEIFFIAPGVDAEKGSVEITLRAPQPPPLLKPDMTVSAKIEVGRKATALFLPSDAMRDAASRP